MSVITITKPTKKDSSIVFDKDRIRRLEYNKIKIKLNKAFLYENLPDTIPTRVLENMLQKYGYVVITKYEGEPYVYQATPTDVPNQYYEYDKYIIVNPYQNISKEITLDKDAVLFRNDSQMIGIHGLMEVYADFKVETNITILLNLILSRLTNVISVNDSDDALAVKKIYEDLAKGSLSSLQLDNILSDANMLQLGENNIDFTKIIEMDKFLKSEIHGLLGMPENDNMKRSYISDTETNLQHQGSMYFILDMLQERREGVERLNELLGTDVTVKLNPEWFGFIEEIKDEVDEQEDKAEDSESSETEDEEKESVITKIKKGIKGD